MEFMKPIFTNTSELSTPFLKAMLKWCMREVGVPDHPRYPLKGKFLDVSFKRSRRHAIYGWADYGRNTVEVWIGPENLFPVNLGHRRAYRTEFIQTVMCDRFEAIVNVTAHGLAHHQLHRRRLRNPEAAPNNERNAETIARGVLQAFRENRATLLASWPSHVPQAKPAAIAVKLDAVEARRKRAMENELKAHAQLAKWERKLKLAKTKIAKYQKRVRYYEKNKVIA